MEATNSQHNIQGNPSELNHGDETSNKAPSWSNESPQSADKQENLKAQIQAMDQPETKSQSTMSMAPNPAAAMPQYENKQVESHTIQTSTPPTASSVQVTMPSNSQASNVVQTATSYPSPPFIQPLLTPDNDTIQKVGNSDSTTISVPNQDPQIQLNSSPQRAVVTKVRLSDELNIFDWFRTTDIISQIADKAKSSVDSVLTVLDPGMKEYLYSGGNINIVVISDHNNMISPIRDAFQTVFGRATVVGAKSSTPTPAGEYPVKLAAGFDGAIAVAQERIKQLRLDTNVVPQNQVILVVQPALVSFVEGNQVNNRVSNGLKSDESLLPRWFLTYCMIVEDPVLGATLSSFSQLIPVDLEIVAIAKEAKFPDNYTNDNLGFARSIDELMNTKLKMCPKGTEESDDQDTKWLSIWAGLDQHRLLHDLSLSLANLYKRKWNECVG